MRVTKTEILAMVDDLGPVWPVGEYGEGVVLATIVGNDNLNISPCRLFEMIEAGSNDGTGVVGDDANGDIHGRSEIRREKGVREVP